MGNIDCERSMFDELLARTSLLPVQLPTSNNRIESILAKSCTDHRPTREDSVRRVIEEDARSTRVVVHRAVWQLISDFLDLKVKYGSEIEKALYSGMDSRALVSRMIQKRPLSFLGRYDYTLLRDGSHIHQWDPRKIWDNVGTLNCQKRDGPPAICTCSCTHSSEQGTPHLSLFDYLSYDEMQISSLLCASTPTFFINSGSRSNKANEARPDTFEDRGVYLGLVGPRFQREGRMEDEWIVIRAAADPNTQLPARAREPPEAAAARMVMWMRLFDVPAEYWSTTVLPAQRYLAETKTPVPRNSKGQVNSPPPQMAPLRHGELFNLRLYKSRVNITVETLLMEANLRGQEDGRQVYIHVVGLGLGVWQVHPQQPQWFVDVFFEALHKLKLPHISTVDFSWIKGVDSCGDIPNGSILQSENCNRIEIKFSKRDPAAKLVRNDQLLVASYAWDGNAFPGNEYWTGKLSASGDGAAACCSTIAQLQNPLVNHLYPHNIVVLP